MTPFRTNWWSHFCKIEGKLIWKHKQYMSCKECGCYNGKRMVSKTTL